MPERCQEMISHGVDNIESPCGRVLMEGKKVCDLHAGAATEREAFRLWTQAKVAIEVAKENLRQAIADEKRYKQATLRIIMSTTDGHTLLTYREMQVVDHVRAGLSNKEIATKLGIEERTIKYHIASILKKTGGQDRYSLGRSDSVIPFSNTGT